MPRSGKKKSRRADIGVPIASMGDIAFLLIIFFMVCSNFAKDPPVELDPATSIKLSEIEDTAIRVTIDKFGTMYLQREEVPDVEAIRYGVEAFVQSRSDSAGPAIVVFKSDAAVPRDVFEPVLEAIAESGATIAAVGEER